MRPFAFLIARDDAASCATLVADFPNLGAAMDFLVEVLRPALFGEDGSMWLDVRAESTVEDVMPELEALEAQTRGTLTVGVPGEEMDVLVSNVMPGLLTALGAVDVNGAKSSLTAKKQAAVLGAGGLQGVSGGISGGPN